MSRIVKALHQALGFATLSSLLVYAAAENQTLNTSEATPGNESMTGGQWIPPNRHLFPYLKADPRQPRCSLGYRWDDRAPAFNNTDVSMANIAGEAPVWYARDVLGLDEIQVGMQAAVWAVFDMKSYTYDLINSDWYGGIPIYFKKGDVRWRLRFFHVSSHMGDEYIIDHGITTRSNLSQESIDLTAYMPIWNDQLFGYATVGRIMHSDSTFPMAHSYFNVGAEYYWKKVMWGASNLIAQPYTAIHTQWPEMYHFEPNINATIGLAWSDKRTGIHRVTTSLEYFAGHSLEGEFALNKTHYVYIQVAYVP